LVADVEVIKLSHAGGIATLDDELLSLPSLLPPDTYSR
jgi:hypothetical protein